MKPFRDNDIVAKLLGGIVLVIILPLVAFQIVVATAWEWLDVRFFKIQVVASSFNRFFTNSLTIHPEDSFMFNVMILNGIFLPFYFIMEGMSVRENGFSWKRMLIYNCLRFGPNVSNFAWVNTLIHKACHSKIFKFAALDNVFEFWIGNFYGVVPGNYSLSHVYNHHVFDNSIEDVITVIDFPRNSFLSWVGYHWRYLVYTVNWSTFWYFYNSQNYLKAAKTAACTVFYLLFVWINFYVFGFAFAYFYVVYPMLQGNLIISCINYTWHAFVHKNDEQNRLINSTTIVNGQYFILEEEYHAVHHLAAGVHYSKHRMIYEKHMNDIKYPTVFYDLDVFTLWGLIVFGPASKLAENSGLPEKLLVERLEHTSKTTRNKRSMIN